MALLVIHVVVVLGTMSHVISPACMSPLTLWHLSRSIMFAVSELQTAGPQFWVFLGCVVWEWECGEGVERIDGEI